MTGCCGKTKTQSVETTLQEEPSTDVDANQSLDNQCRIDLTGAEIPYLWYPTLQSVKQIEYVRKLEGEFACLQRAFLTMTTHFARMQFRLRQITQASPCERDALLADLEKLAFEGMEENDGDELPRIQRDLRCMGDVRRKQHYILEKLRNQLSALTEASELEGIEEPYEPTDTEEHNETTSCCSRKSCFRSSSRRSSTISATSSKNNKST